MGIRQPSKTSVFFAQAKAGAEGQKKAREQLKSPQAIGGSAAAGTSMIASATGAQKAATGQVQSAGESATKDLTIKPENIGSSTVAAITGTPTVAPAGQTTTTPAPAPITPIQGPNVDMSQFKVEGKGAEGDVSAVETLGTNISTTIDTLTTDLDNINKALVTADTQDRANLSAEKTRLEGLLQQYQDKITKENLGQIAGPYETEINMLEREQLLASEGQRVAKLASIFGPGWNARRYGGLESQIYGKDLEAVQEAAGAGLQAREQAAREADVSQEQYKKRLVSSKAEYEKGLKSEQQKLDYLKATPQELAGVSKSEMYKLFGAETAEKLFDFDDKGFVSGTETAKVRDAYAKTIADLGTEKGKVQGELSTAQTVKNEKEFQTAADAFFGKPGQAPSYESNISYLNRLKDQADAAKKGFESSVYIKKKGYSGVTSRYDTAINTANAAIEKINNLVAQADEARKNKDSAKLVQLKKELNAASKIDGQDIFNYLKNIIDTAQNDYGK